ncbi:CopD family protein [Ahrensia kielensis]|uniref:Protoporphyrinogen IX oxidase n=1 Tax=Ahrensia kielensis TaxID=76980 RepID=A0ABU9T3G2_9HYPH
MIELYPFFVAAHVTSVVFFVGGMLIQARMVLDLAYLPATEKNGTLSALLRLDRQIITPAMLLTWMFGITLAVWMGWFSSPWLIIKLVIVVALSGLHGAQSGRLRRAVQSGQNPILKGASVAIVLAMLVIATLAFVKPF